MGAALRIQSCFPSRLMEEAVVWVMAMRKQAAASTRGKRGISAPASASSRRTSSMVPRKNRAATLSATSMMRPTPALRKYMGVPKNFLASFFSRAARLPEADTFPSR